MDKHLWTDTWGIYKAWYTNTHTCGFCMLWLSHKKKEMQPLYKYSHRSSSDEKKHLYCIITVYQYISMYISYKKSSCGFQKGFHCFRLHGTIPTLRFKQNAASILHLSTVSGIVLLAAVIGFRAWRSKHRVKHSSLAQLLSNDPGKTCWVCAKPFREPAVFRSDSRASWEFYLKHPETNYSRKWDAKQIYENMWKQILHRLPECSGHLLYQPKTEI